MSTNTNNIEVCIAVYQRYYRLPEIIKQLNAQTDQKFNFNIWNNTDKDLTPFVRDFPKSRLKIFGTGKNEGSAARFKIVPKVKGNIITFIDDDEEIEDGFVEYHRAVHKKYPNCVAGWYTRIFNTDNYSPSVDLEQIPIGSAVDYVGTGGMVVDRKIFDDNPILQNIPEPYDKVEDLFLCHIARKNGMELVRVKQSVRILVDGKDQFQKIDKNDIYRRLREEEGFITLTDKYLEKNAYENLKDLKEVFEKHDIPFWVQEGLLLGLYREGHIIRGDEDDTDICVWKEHAEKVEKAIPDLEAKGFRILDKWVFEDTIEGMPIARGTNKIDIIMTRKKESKDGVVYFLARNYDKTMGDLDYFAFVFSADIYSKFSEIEWGEEKYKVPGNIEKYLVERYGEDWKTPKARGVDYNPSSLSDNPCYRYNWDHKNPDDLL